jgi:hypothetical protein
LRAKNMVNHKLGSRGYIGKQRVWREEDEAATSRDMLIGFMSLVADCFGTVL